MAPAPDNYELLGVAPDATADQIKGAYRNLTKVAHPDRGGNEALFTMINEAYRVLSDPIRRAEYDRSRSHASEPTPPKPAAPPSASPWTPPPRPETASRAPRNWDDQGVAPAGPEPDEEFVPVSARDLTVHLALIGVLALGWYLLRATGVLDAITGPLTWGGDVMERVRRLLGPPVQPVVAVAVVAAAVLAEWKLALGWHLRAFRPGLARGCAVGVVVGGLAVGEYLTTPAGIALAAAIAVLIVVADVLIARRHRSEFRR